MSVRRIQSRASRFFLAFVALALASTSFATPLSATEPNYDARAYLEAKLLYHAVMSCTLNSGAQELSNDDVQAGRFFHITTPSAAQWVEGLYLAHLTGSPDPRWETCDSAGSVRMIQTALRVWNLDGIKSLVCNFEDPSRSGMLKPSQSGTNCSEYTGTWILELNTVQSYLRDTFLSQRFNQDGLTGVNWPFFTEEQQFYLFAFTVQSSTSACQEYAKIVDTVHDGVDSLEVVLSFSDKGQPVNSYFVSRDPSKPLMQALDIREQKMFEDEFGSYIDLGLNRFDAMCYDLVPALAPDSSYVQAAMRFAQPDEPELSACVRDKMTSFESERARQITIHDQAVAALAQDEIDIANAIANDDSGALARAENSKVNNINARDKAASEIERVGMQIASLLENPDEFCPPVEPPAPPVEQDNGWVLFVVIGGIALALIIVGFIIFRVIKVKKSSDVVIRKDPEKYTLGRLALLAKRIKSRDIKRPEPPKVISVAPPLPELLPLFMNAVMRNDAHQIGALAESGAHTHGLDFATEIGKGIRILARTPGSLAGLKSLADFSHSKDGQEFLNNLAQVAPKVRDYLVVMEIEGAEKAQSSGLLSGAA